MGHGFFNANSQTVYKAKSPHHDLVRLHFGTKGDYNFYFKQLYKTFSLIGGHVNLMYSPDFDLEVYNKTHEIETFGVNFKKDVFLQFAEASHPALTKFADKIASGESCILSDRWGGINTKLQLALNQATHNIYTGSIQNNFILSKAIELLVYAVEACEYVNNQSESEYLSRSDKEKVIAARDFVNTNIQNPPNLSEISRHVSLNEFKLKSGFKTLFGSTIFQYTTEQRLQLAAQLVRNTHTKINEIAADLGYATPQHFNNAFKQKYNITPKKMRTL